MKNKKADKELEGFMPENKKAEWECTTNPMPPNTKKCETCNWRESEIGYPSPCPKHSTHTPEKEYKGLRHSPTCHCGNQIGSSTACEYVVVVEDATPTPAVEKWEEKLKVMILSRGMGVSLNDCVNYVRSLREADRKRIVDEIAKHNARILNHFQLQGTPEMPMIAYDERVCLVPAIEAATKETLTNLK